MTNQPDSVIRRILDRIPPSTHRYTDCRLGIAVLLQDYKKANDLTIKSLAVKLNRSPRTVRNWLGGWSNLTLKDLIAIELALDITLLDLKKFDDENQ